MERRKSVRTKKTLRTRLVNEDRACLRKDIRTQGDHVCKWPNWARKLAFKMPQVKMKDYFHKLAQVTS